MRFDLDALSEPSPLQQIALDAIDEDPGQPRQEFEPAALAELADTIRERGVLQPVSVRRHSTQPGRYVLNFGARRLRASRLASKTSIPAFIDELATSYDQIVENEQREGLTPLELALFVERRLKAGDSQADIARRLGKSRPYVTYATALIDPPDWLLMLYRQGRCRGLLELYELRHLHACCPETARWLESGDEPITRQRIAAAKSTMVPDRSLKAARAGDTAPADGAPARERHVAAAPSQVRPKEGTDPDTCERSTYVLVAELNGQTVEVIVDDAPPDEGDVFVRTKGKGDRYSAPAGAIRLIGLEVRSARSAV